ncbi:hypothetical protein BH10PSE1_BH10PSE1_20260 [soil metagenome]
MRRFAFFAPLAATLALAAVAEAEPNNQPRTAAPTVTVTIGGDLSDDVEKLGRRDVDEQVDGLVRSVERELARSGALSGAQVNLVLTDLKPNRPTFQQASDKPGLSIFDSISIGGATIEGEVITAEGERLPVRYSRYSNNITDVFGFSTWWDADRAFDSFASNLSHGRPVYR